MELITAGAKSAYFRHMDNPYTGQCCHFVGWQSGHISNQLTTPPICGHFNHPRPRQYLPIVFSMNLES